MGFGYLRRARSPFREATAARAAWLSQHCGGGGDTSEKPRFGHLQDAALNLKAP
jgi:hypothetical protein